MLEQTLGKLAWRFGSSGRGFVFYFGYALVKILGYTPGQAFRVAFDPPTG